MEYNPIVNESINAPMLDISAVKKKPVKSMVSVLGFVNVDDLSVYQTGWRQNAVTKAETMINDNEAQMKIVFWQDTVSKLSGEGVYKIRNLRVNIFNEEQYVGITANTTIEKIDSSVIKKMSCPSNTGLPAVSFPPVSITSTKVACSSCNSEQVSFKADLFLSMVAK